MGAIVAPRRVLDGWAAMTDLTQGSVKGYCSQKQGTSRKSYSHAQSQSRRADEISMLVMHLNRITGRLHTVLRSLGF